MDQLIQADASNGLVDRASSQSSPGADKTSPGYVGGNWNGEAAGESAEETRIQNGELKRKRPMMVTCEMCKLRKVKCDRGQPSCGWCVRNRQLCEYKERKKPGLRAGYGRELEQRIDRLEELIHSQDQLFKQHILACGSGQRQSSNDQGVFQSSPLHQTSHIASPETSLFMQRESAFADQDHTAQGQAISDAPLDHSLLRTDALPVESSAQRQGPLYPQLQESSHRQALEDALHGTQAYYSQNQDAIASSSLDIENGQPHQLQVCQSDNDFPPYDLLYALVDLYFKHINTWCPILHRKTTLDVLFGPSTLETADRILLHAIVATTLRFSTDGRLTDESRAHYHDISKEKVLLYGLENSSVKALQALVILALDFLGSSNGPPAWNVLALITRSVVQLGLAVEATSQSISPTYLSIYTLRAVVLPEAKSWIEDESRRRLFWMVYLLDRYATVATAFDFALDEKEVDRKLPCRDDLWSRNQNVETSWFKSDERSEEYKSKRGENFGSFSYYVEVVGILSKIHMFLKKPVNICAPLDVEKWQQEYRELNRTLAQWHRTLPNEYRNMSRLFSSNGNTKVVNCTWVMLHAAYQTTIIRLHSSAAYPTARSLIFTPSYAATTYCLRAVDNIHNLTKYVINMNLLSKLGPPFAFSVWVASRLLLVHGSTVEHKVSPMINFFVDTLREMGRYWDVARRYACLLTRVLDEYHESERLAAGNDGERVTPSSVQILADMRRCAFDLDFLISRQPRMKSQQQAFVGAGDTALAQGQQQQPGLESSSRTPLPNELDYMDVFDWFNVPRLSHATGYLNGSLATMPSGDRVTSAAMQSQTLGTTMNEFNITNYMTPNPQADWLITIQE